jgi:DNA-binding response OmpR family regulator
MRIRRILMAMADPGVAAMYRLELELDGFSVQVVHTAETALTLARRSPWNLVLLDLGLPGSGGLELLAALRSDTRTADLPVVAFSNRHDTGLLDRAMALGATDYLIKTHTTPAQVSHSILRWVATQRARPASLPMRVMANAVADGAVGSGE